MPCIAYSHMSGNPATPYPDNDLLDLYIRNPEAHFVDNVHGTKG